MAQSSLTQKQRNLIADRFMQLGNFIFIAMAIAPLISNQEHIAVIFSLIFMGLFVWGFTYFVAEKIMRGDTTSYKEKMAITIGAAFVVPYFFWYAFNQ